MPWIQWEMREGLRQIKTQSSATIKQCYNATIFKRYTAQQLCISAQATQCNPSAPQSNVHCNKNDCTNHSARCSTTHQCVLHHSAIWVQDSPVYYSWLHSARCSTTPVCLFHHSTISVHSVRCSTTPLCVFHQSAISVQDRPVCNMLQCKRLTPASLGSLGGE